MNSLLLIAPITLPFLTGVLLYFPRLDARKRNILAEISVLINSALILMLLLVHPEEELVLLHLTKSIVFTLRLDGLSVVFLALIGFLWPLAMLYTVEYMKGEHHLPRFYAFYVMSFGVTCGVALSGNLITLYFFYELLTLATVPLVAHEQNRRSMKAARKYIIYSIGGAALSFVGMMMLYSRCGLQGFEFGGLQQDMNHDPFLLTAYLFTFAGFGVKAAIFPLQDWLPSAGVAPTPVTALLHAVAVVKSGVFACIRSAFYVFGPALLVGTVAQYIPLTIASVTVVFGSAMAYKEQHWKRRLAYSTVSNLSYILLGMALLTTEGLIAALSHMVFHGIMKITLFFCAGTVLCKTGREYVSETEGLGRKMPLTFAVYLLAGLALTGTPLLPGFISKMNLLNAVVDLGGGFAYAGAAALLISALLTASYLIPMSVRSFLPRKNAVLEFGERDRDPGKYMLIPFAVLCVAMVVLGVHSTPVMQWLENLILGGI